MSGREALRRIIKHSYLTGDFTLTHGNRADDYYDLSQVLLSSYGLILVCREIEELLRDVQFDAVGCLELCPTPIVGGLLRSSTLRCQHGFIVRKASKGYGTNKSVENSMCWDCGVVIVEDVIATGYSVLKAIRAVEERHCDVRAVVSVINRREGCEELLKDYNVLSIFTKEDLL